MAITLARRPYVHRPTLDPFTPGWFDSEHALIEQAIPVPVSKTVTADYTATVLDDLILVDATGGTVNITLPDPSRVAFLVLKIKKIDASSNPVVLVGTVDGIVNQSTDVQNSAIMIESDGVAWWIIAEVTGPGSGFPGANQVVVHDGTGSDFVFTQSGNQIVVH